MKVLLHSCCAPCSAAILEWMTTNGYEPSIYFFNPNIFPQEEYLHRKNEIKRYALNLGIEVVDEDGTEDSPALWTDAHLKWKNGAELMASEPERGKRCAYCFRYRLLKSAEYASKHGFRLITTSLMSSRWKDINQIMEAGKWAASKYPELEFWDKNWRKGGLYERRNILARQFYNQRYCGCEYSIR
ncbi:MAG: epoxyqueuosine reductase QueH [Alistipes sp.]|nr:epoxyqueuosine reductase QueH [Candidatus Minthomonas equi]